MARTPKPVVVAAAPATAPNVGPITPAPIGATFEAALTSLLSNLDKMIDVSSSSGLPGQPGVPVSATKHVVIAASGSHVWTPNGARILRKVISDTAQWALTQNGMTYTNIQALGAPSDIGGSGILIYSNAAIQDNLAIFIPHPTQLTLSVSASGTQRITLIWDCLT